MTAARRVANPGWRGGRRTGPFATARVDGRWPGWHPDGCRGSRALVFAVQAVGGYAVTLGDSKRFAGPLALLRSCPPYVRDQWTSRTHDRIPWWPAPLIRTCSRCLSGETFSQLNTA